MTYRVLKDGEGVNFRSGERFKFACCDCGLVHDMVIVARGRKVGMAVKRNKRATAARRRAVNGSARHKLTCPALHGAACSCGAVYGLTLRSQE